VTTSTDSFRRASVRFPPAMVLDPPAEYDPLHIVIDTREQVPPYFPESVKVNGRTMRIETERATLKEGDYTTRALRSVAVIERKNPTDFLASIFDPRFGRELERLAPYEQKRIFVESTFDEIVKLSLMPPRSILGRCDSLGARWDCEVVWCRDAAGCAARIVGYLRRWEEIYVPRKTPAERLRDAADRLGLADNRVRKGMRELVAREHLRDRFEADPWGTRAWLDRQEVQR
jgi:ERCC4-type nuclease